MHKKLWNKDFILMLQGSAFSVLGDVLYSVAIGYWVYDQTGSSALMGLMSSISMFMTMFLSPFTGSIIDKCNRKAIIVGMDVIRGIIMLIIGALAFGEKLSVGAVMAAAFLASACSLFFNPAVSTFMLDIIPHDDMVRGQSVSSGLSALLNLIGKAVSGALVAVVLLGIIKLKPRTRYLAMAIGFISTVFLSTGAYLAGSFPTVTVLLFLNSFMNMLANSVFNASLMLALPEENRGAILGFISAFSTGGCALSAVIFGVLGDLFPLYLVFMAGNVLSLLPMLYLCLHKKTKEFVLSH